MAAKEQQCLDYDAWTIHVQGLNNDHFPPGAKYLSMARMPPRALTEIQRGKQVSDAQRRTSRGTDGAGSVELAPKLHGFGDVLRGDVFSLSKIRDGPCDLHDPVAASCRELETVAGGIEHTVRFLPKGTVSVEYWTW